VHGIALNVDDAHEDVTGDLDCDHDNSDHDAAHRFADYPDLFATGDSA